jgi:hypothetical protein
MVMDGETHIKASRPVFDIVHPYKWRIMVLRTFCANLCDRKCGSVIDDSCQ